MICPNCGYNQQEGNVCGECHTLLKGGSSSSSYGIEQGWKKGKSFTDHPSKSPPNKDKTSGEKTTVIENTPPKTQVPLEPKKELKKKPDIIENEISENEIEEQNTMSIGKFEEKTGETDERIMEEVDPDPRDEEIKAKDVPQSRRPLRIKKSNLRGDSPISLTLKRLQEVLITTTENFYGKIIEEYKGIIQSSSIAKLETLDSYSETVKDVGGLRNTHFQEHLSKALAIAISDLKIEAVKLNANAIVGVKVHHEYRSPNNLLLHIVGTAVHLGGEKVQGEFSERENG